MEFLPFLSNINEKALWEKKNVSVKGNKVVRTLE